MRKTFNRYRVYAALICLVGVTLYANLSLMASGITTYRQGHQADAVTAYEARMKNIKGALPPSAVVGYVTTVDNRQLFSREKTFEDVELLAQYIVTQYVLAPVVVQNSPDYPLVIGNFIGGSPDPGLIARERLVPVKDFGDGLILYRREGRR